MGISAFKGAVNAWGGGGHRVFNMFILIELADLLRKSCKFSTYILTGLVTFLKESCKFNKYIPTELVALLKESVTALNAQQ
jgi:hypothetical protein